jgi:hypothetical protein
MQATAENLQKRLKRMLRYTLEQEDSRKTSGWIDPAA